MSGITWYACPERPELWTLITECPTYAWTKWWRAMLGARQREQGLAAGPWHKWPDERPKTGKHLVVRVRYRGRVLGSSDVIETFGYEGCYFTDDEVGENMDAIMQGVTHWAYVVPPNPDN